MVQIVVEHFRETVVPLPKFGREREGVALSQVKLTHHNQKNRGKLKMYLHDKDSLHLDPISEAGSVAVQEKQKDRLSEIIEKVNAPFTGELTENDKLVYVNNVILGKLLESETLAKQADSNTKEQFGNSPILNTELTDGIMNAPDSLTEMSPPGAELRHNQTRTEIHPAESHQPI